MAQRIQRKRTKGYRLPPNAVCVSRPTKWGNPFTLSDRAEAVALFRDYVLARGAGYPLSELRGKDLACWCPLVDTDGKPVPCHADVLLALAND